MVQVPIDLYFVRITFFHGDEEGGAEPQAFTAPASILVVVVTVFGNIFSHPRKWMDMHYFCCPKAG